VLTRKLSANHALVGGACVLHGSLTTINCALHDPARPVVPDKGAQDATRLVPGTGLCPSCKQGGFKGILLQCRMPKCHLVMRWLTTVRQCSRALAALTDLPAVNSSTLSLTCTMATAVAEPAVKKAKTEYAHTREVCSMGQHTVPQVSPGVTPCSAGSCWGYFPVHPKSAILQVQSAHSVHAKLHSFPP
jgi:hypothetical protein